VALTSHAIWDAITSEAAAESALWATALRPEGEREAVPVFSPLAEDRFALGLETIYEGYLLHYGRPRLFAPEDRDTTVLLGDYLYAHGLVRIADLGEVAVVTDLAELLSLCAQLRADGEAAADGLVWAATIAMLGSGDERLAPARGALRDEGEAAPLRDLAADAVGADALSRALALHAVRIPRR
jgi:hypothetical protein